MSEDLIDKEIEVSGKSYTLEMPKAAGFKGVVWKGRDELGIPVAIKFAIMADYEDRSYLQEANKAKQLRGYPRFAELIDADIVNLHLSYGETNFVCFIEEWIEGDTLDVFLLNGKYSSAFLVEFVRMMSEALANLYYFELCHDDLHGKNIILSPPKPGSLEPYESQVKIIDMGSLKSAPSKRIRQIIIGLSIIL